MVSHRLARLLMGAGGLLLASGSVLSWTGGSDAEIPWRMVVQIHEHETQEMDIPLLAWFCTIFLAAMVLLPNLFGLVVAASSVPWLVARPRISFVLSVATRFCLLLIGVPVLMLVAVLILDHGVSVDFNDLVSLAFFGLLALIPVAVFGYCIWWIVRKAPAERALGIGRLIGLVLCLAAYSLHLWDETRGSLVRLAPRSSGIGLGIWVPFLGSLVALVGAWQEVRRTGATLDVEREFGPRWGHEPGDRKPV